MTPQDHGSILTELGGNLTVVECSSADAWLSTPKTATTTKKQNKQNWKPYDGTCTCQCWFKKNDILMKICLSIVIG